METPLDPTASKRKQATRDTVQAMMKLYGFGKHFDRQGLSSMNELKILLDLPVIDWPSEINGAS
jgi:hypothetical protein